MRRIFNYHFTHLSKVPSFLLAYLAPFFFTRLATSLALISSFKPSVQAVRVTRKTRGARGSTGSKRVVDAGIRGHQEKDERNTELRKMIPKPPDKPAPHISFVSSLRIPRPFYAYPSPFPRHFSIDVRIVGFDGFQSRKNLPGNQIIFRFFMSFPFSYFILHTTYLSIPFDWNSSTHG